MSNLNKKIDAKSEAWRNRPIEGEHPYVFLDGIVMKRAWAGEVRNVSLLVAIGVNAEGYREILGICEGAKEDKSGWSAFLRHLVDRGLKGVELVTSDACRGLVESIDEFLPDARWQRCVVHFYRNVFSHVPAAKVREVSHMLKAIHAQETRATAAAKASAVVDELRRQRYGARCGPRRRPRPRDPDLLRLSGLPLDQDPNQQPARADHARDPATNPRGRGVPRRSALPQPRRGQATPHRRHPMVDQTVFEHAAAQAAQRHDRLTRAGHRPKCERFWTLPDEPPPRA